MAALCASIGVDLQMSKAKSFWATFPGILTGIAGVIAAIAALISALHLTGIFSDSSDSTRIVEPITPVIEKSTDQGVYRQLSVSELQLLKGIDGHPNSTNESFEVVLLNKTYWRVIGLTISLSWYAPDDTEL